MAKTIIRGEKKPNYKQNLCPILFVSKKKIIKIQLNQCTPCKWRNRVAVYVLIKCHDVGIPNENDKKTYVKQTKTVRRFNRSVSINNATDT